MKAPFGNYYGPTLFYLEKIQIIFYKMIVLKLKIASNSTIKVISKAGHWLH